MSYRDLIDMYGKVNKVIWSCKTVGQYNSAVAYVNLYINLLPPLLHARIVPLLKTSLRFKKKKLISF